VRKGLITVHHFATDLQIADLLTKPQPEPLFVVIVCATTSHFDALANTSLFGLA
jgi:hypothetical protein